MRRLLQNGFRNAISLVSEHNGASPLKQWVKKRLCSWIERRCTERNAVCCAEFHQGFSRHLRKNGKMKERPHRAAHRFIAE